MERENRLQAREEFIFTLEQRLAKGTRKNTKVDPLDKKALLELVTEEIESYKKGVIDSLSSINQLAQLMSVSFHSVYCYLQNLSSQDYMFRSKIVKAQGWRASYATGIGKISIEEKREIGRRGAQTQHTLYGNPFNKLSAEERLKNAKKGALRTIEIYGPHRFTTEQRRKGALALTHEQRKRCAFAAKEARRKRDSFIIVEIVFPLLVRGSSREEMVEITGLSPEQISHAKEYIKKSPYYGYSRLNPSLNKKTNQKLLTKDQRNNLFLRELLISRIVPVNHKYWDRLHNLDNQYNIGLPESFAEKVCLESFLVARMYAETAERDPKKGNREYLERYIKCGMRIDSTWFKTKLIFYEGFLKEAIYLLKQTS